MIKSGIIKKYYANNDDLKNTIVEHGLGEVPKLINFSWFSERTYLVKSTYYLQTTSGEGHYCDGNQFGKGYICNGRNITDIRGSTNYAIYIANGYNQVNGSLKPTYILSGLVSVDSKNIYIKWDISGEFSGTESMNISWIAIV